MNTQHQKSPLHWTPLSAHFWELTENDIFAGYTLSHHPQGWLLTDYTPKANSPLIKDGTYYPSREEALAACPLKGVFP